MYLTHSQHTKLSLLIDSLSLLTDQTVTEEAMELYTTLSMPQHMKLHLKFIEIK